MTSELINGAIFLHIPKTGGTWVIRALKDQALVRRNAGRVPHTAYEHAVQFPAEKRKWKQWSRAENWQPGNLFRPGRTMKLPYTFCFVRHPVRWYESWWRYLQGMQDRAWLEQPMNPERLLKRWNTLTVPARSYLPDFNAFVANMLARFPGYVTWLYGMYAVPDVDFVGRQEQLADGLIHVLRELRLPFDEGRLRQRPSINKSKMPQEAVRWDAGLLRDVQAAEQTIMLRYGYPVLTTDDLWPQDAAAGVSAL